MRRLLHLSDLHFGRVDPVTLEPLVEFVNNSQCDLAIISGDLTQRARRGQFAEAKKFLDSLSIKQIVIPGNHDIPLYKFWVRFYKPFRYFVNIISKETEPTYVDDEIAVLGVNTVSLWKVEGAFSSRRFQRLARRFNELPSKLVKILVTHHPVPLHKLEASGLHFDLLLAGHEHQAGFSVHVVEKMGRHLLIQAGTATSTRLRNGFTNSFNVIEIDGSQIKVTHMDWLDKKQFKVSKEGTFRKADHGWYAV